jgi:hypothetical protein
LTLAQGRSGRAIKPCTNKRFEDPTAKLVGYE